MPQNDMLRRYLDAGMAFTQMTRERAESIVKDLVKAGEVQQKQAQKRVDELMERSRSNTEQMIDLVRKEVMAQLSAMGLATKDDIKRVEARIDALRTAGGGGATAGGATAGAGAGSGAAKKAPAKKLPGAKKVAGAKKAPARKAAGTTAKA